MCRASPHGDGPHEAAAGGVGAEREPARAGADSWTRARRHPRRGSPAAPCCARAGSQAGLRARPCGPLRLPAPRERAVALEGTALEGSYRCGGSRGFRADIARHRVPVSPAAGKPRRTPAGRDCTPGDPALANGLAEVPMLGRPLLYCCPFDDRNPHGITIRPGVARLAQEALHPHVRMPDERVRLGQDGRRAPRLRRDDAHRAPRGRRRHPLQHVLGAREGAGARLPRLGPRARAQSRESRPRHRRRAAASRRRRVPASCAARLTSTWSSARRRCTACRSSSPSGSTSGRPQVDVSFPEIEKFDHLPPPRVEGATAFVSIMEGCSKYCSFCVVPYTRGEEVSRPFDDVLTEVADLADQGVREITLLGPERERLSRPQGERRDRRLRHAARIRGRDARGRAHPLHHLASEGDDAAAHRALRDPRASS